MAVDRERLAALLASGLSRQECADAMGVSFSSVKGAIARHHLHSTCNGGDPLTYARTRPAMAHGYHDDGACGFGGASPAAQVPHSAQGPWCERGAVSGRTESASPARGSVAPGAGVARDVQRLVDLCRARGRSMREICDALDVSPRRAEQLLADARAGGYTVDVAGGEVSWRKPEAAPVEPASAAIKPCTGNRFKLGVCSDLHFGSKYCMREQLSDYAQQAYASGVRTFVVSGDILDGCYRHGVWELSHHGWDEQARDAFESLPRLDGAAWYFIDGNHDGTFWDQTGAVSGERLQDYFAQRGRDDLIYLGHREGNLSLRLAGVRRPVAVQLWHPKPGKAYALSYQLQKRIEAYAPGTKPDVLIAGHWHTCVYLETRGIHSLAAGCFQSPESAFARSLAGGVSCGGWVLSWECTAAGTMRRVAAERWAYFHREDSRELELVAS